MKKIFTLFTILSLGLATFTTANALPVNAPQQAAQHVTKSGTPDKRYKANQHLKKDGTPDKRYSSNKNMKKDGTPDMRYK